MIGVYGIYNKVADKWYVGSSIRINRRFQEHRTFLKSNKHHNPKLQAAYNKYGKDAFEYSILATYSSSENLEHYEILWTIALNAIKGGYVLKAGNRNAVISDETKKKISSWQKGIKKGPYSEEHRRNISEGQKGNKRGPLSDETKKKISASSLGHKKIFSEEHKQKIRILKTGKRYGPRSEETRNKIAEALKNSWAKRKQVEIT